MKKLTLISATLGFVILLGCKADNNNTVQEPKEVLFPATKIALNNMPDLEDLPKSKVMVLGTFHFNKSTDGSDVVAKNHIDVKTPESQSQLQALTDKIVKEFKPTRIAVEWLADWQITMDTLLVSYLSGKRALGINEAFQIGYRVAEAMGIDRIHCVDNRPKQPESVTSVDDWDLYAEQMGQNELWHAFDEPNKAFNEYVDEQYTQLNLLEYLQMINHPKHSRRHRQLWLTGLVNLGQGDKYLGADLAGLWNVRNTRIFANVRALVEDEPERILVIYGAGHKWNLDELFEASPEFELIQPDLNVDLN